MPFHRKIVEARLTLKLIPCHELPALAWDALEAGLDGPAIRRLAALEKPTWSEPEGILSKASQEMGLTILDIGEAALRLAKQQAQEILIEGKDPLKFTKEFWHLWVQADYCSAIQGFGVLDDEVWVARSMGQSETEIRQWLRLTLQKLVGT